MRWVLAPLAAVVVASGPSIALAEDTDGAYGRLDGDLLLQAGAGIAVAFGGPHLALDLRALYLSSAGVYVRYSDALGQKGARYERDISAGVELRPFFLARFARDLEKGPARLDLFVDSFSLQLGAAWQEPQGRPLAELPAFELGVGLEFPLLARGSGPFLGAEGLLRLDDLAGNDKRNILEQGSQLVFTFSWHQCVHAGMADFRDRR